MPMDLYNVRLRCLAKYGNCNRDDIPMIVLVFLEEYQNCDWDEIPMMISDYLRQEICNLPKVVVNDETDDDEEENEVTYYHHEVSHFVLQDSSMIEPNLIENSDLEDDGSIEYNDDYSNDYVPRSFKFVYEDSEDEEDEYYAYDNYPPPTTQVVLQVSQSLEPELTESSELEDSDFDNSDFEENMEEEVEEILVMPDLEVVESATTSPILKEHEPNVSYSDSYVIVDYDADIKELQEVLGISDHELDKLVEKGDGDDLILEAEFENLYRASSTQVQTEIGGGDLDDPSRGGSKSGLMSHSLPCNCEYILLKELKPPGYSFVESVCSGGIVKSNILHEKMTELLEVDRLARLDMHTECVHLNYFEEPPDSSGILVRGFSEDVGVTSNSYLKMALIKFIIRSLKGWIVYVHVISFSWRMFYRNDKTKEDILMCEYDEKGGGCLMKDWL